MEQIGKRLRGLREGIRLTQVQMAQILGVQQSRINRFETGQSTPSPAQTAHRGAAYNPSGDLVRGRIRTTA